MILRVALLAAAVAALIFSAGAEGISRLSLRLGLPSIALALNPIDEMRGLALYRLGRYAEAADALNAAGRSSAYNRGNAFAFAGDYAHAVQAYDAAIARDPAHAEAVANRAIVAKLINSATESGGGSRPQGTEQGERSKTENKSQSMTMQEAEAAWRKREIEVRRNFESKALIADEQWLKTMADEPGRYLKLRIAAEYERRLRQGIAAPPGDDPW